MNVTPIGLKIKTIRTLHGLSQDNFARVLEVAQSHLSDIEQGRKRYPKTIEKIEVVFDLKLDSPAVNAAFAILSSDHAVAAAVEAALALLETPPGNQARANGDQAPCGK